MVKAKKKKTTKKNKKEESEALVLIIEDDELLLRAMYLFFHKRNYTVASATDGESGFQMAQRLKPDIILLDLLLPKLDGFGVLKNLKADSTLKKTPVVVLSNLGDEGDLNRAKDLGVKEYFIKSNTDLADLADKIDSILKK